MAAQTNDRGIPYLDPGGSHTRPAEWPAPPSSCVAVSWQVCAEFQVRAWVTRHGVGGAQTLIQKQGVGAA